MLIPTLLAALVIAPMAQNKKPAPKPAARPSAGKTQTKPPAKPAPAASEVVGIWEGAFDLRAGIMITVVLRVNQGASGLAATVTLPDQSDQAIPVTISRDDRHVTFALGGAMSFAGDLSADGKSIEGTLTQRTEAKPMTLRKVARPTEPARPQTPKPPFPYRTVEVSYPNPDAPGVKLAGTLCVPPGAGPFACAIFITGSGAQDRDESILRHKPFAVIADYLARRGIASLRLDDRGMGGSTGAGINDTSADFASDVRAGVSFLRARPEIDPKRVGLIGHSEGGFIAPMVAASDKGIAFIVLLGGTGVPGAKLLEVQSARILAANGVPDATIKASGAVQSKFLAMAAADGELADVRKSLSDAMHKLSPIAPQAIIDDQVAQLTAPWMRYFLRTDPAQFLEKVNCPVLALNGEKDTQVDADQNLPAIEAALKKAGNTDVTIVRFPGLNHLFQTAKTGAPGEYAGITETVSPPVLERIGNWLVAHVGQSKP